MDGLYLSSDFRILQCRYQSFGDWTQSTNYKLYHVTFMFHSLFFLILLQGSGIYPSFRFPSILLCSQPGHRRSQFGKFFFFSLNLVVWPRLGDPFVFQNLPLFDGVRFQYSQIFVCFLIIIISCNSWRSCSYLKTYNCVQTINLTKQEMT